MRIFSTARVLKVFDIGWATSPGGLLPLTARYQEYGYDETKTDRFGVLTALVLVQRGQYSCTGLRATKANNGNGSQYMTPFGALALVSTGTVVPPDHNYQWSQPRSCKGAGPPAYPDSNWKKNHDNKPPSHTCAAEDAGDKTGPPEPGDPLPLPTGEPDPLPGESAACGDETWHFDRVRGDGAGYSYEIDIHNTPTDVEVCTTITNPGGQVIFDEDVVVPKDTDPTDYLPPFNPPTVETDAPDGEGPDSPCTQSSGTGQGTDNARGYARTGQSGSDTIVCVGFRAPGAQRHVRVTVH